MRVALFLLLSAIASAGSAPAVQSVEPTERRVWPAAGFPNWGGKLLTEDVATAVTGPMGTGRDVAIDPNGVAHEVKVNFRWEPTGTRWVRLNYRRQSSGPERALDGFTIPETIHEKVSGDHTIASYHDDVDSFCSVRLECDQTGNLHLFYIDKQWDTELDIPGVYPPKPRLQQQWRLMHIIGTPDEQGKMSWGTPASMTPEIIFNPEWTSEDEKYLPVKVFSFELYKGWDGELRGYGLREGGNLMVFTVTSGGGFQDLQGDEPGAYNQPASILAAPAQGGGFHIWYTMNRWFTTPEYRYVAPGAPLSSYTVIPLEDVPLGGFTDSQGRLHLWKTNHYKEGLEAPWTNLGYTIYGIAEDDRQQLIAYTTEYFAGRMKNPDPNSISPTWTTSMGLGFGGTLLMGTPRKVRYTPGDSRVHVVFTKGYFHTLHYGVGVRDPESMVPLFDGGAGDAISGNQNVSIPLFSMAGLPPLAGCALTYNSLDASEGLLGRGWRLGYEMTITRAGNLMTLRLPDGRLVPFLGTEEPNSEFTVTGLGTATFGKIVPVGTGPDYEYILSTKNLESYWFNKAGQLRMIEVPQAGHCQYLYDAQGLLVEIRDQLPGPGRSVKLTYQGSGQRSRVASIQDPEGGVYTLEYDAEGRLLKVKRPGVPAYEMAYAAGNNFGDGEKTGLLKSFKFPSGRQWKLKYLPDGRILKCVDPLAEVVGEAAEATPSPTEAETLFKFVENDGLNDPRETRITDRRGKVSKFLANSALLRAFEIYDPIALANPGGSVGPLKRTFSIYGHPTQITDRWGVVTKFTYSPGVPSWVQDNLTMIRREPKGTGAQIDVQTFTYSTDSMNLLKTRTTTVNGVAATTTYGYDGGGRLISITHPTLTPPGGTQPETASRSLTYLAGGLCASIVDEEGGETLFMDHDPVHRLPRRVMRPGAAQGENIQFDLMGRLLSQTPPRGSGLNEAPQTMTTARDAAGRVMRTTDAAGQATTYEYDMDGRLLRVVPPVGGATTYTYDGRGLLSGGSGPEGSWSRTVDANGNVRESTNVRGHLSKATHDEVGRVKTSKVEGGSTQFGGAQQWHETEFKYDSVVNDLFVDEAVENYLQPNNKRTNKVRYDAYHRPVASIAPDGVTENQTAYDEQSRPYAKQLVVNGVVQTCSVLSRDPRERVFKTRVQNAVYTNLAPSQKSESWVVYNRANAVVKTIDPLGTPTGGLAHTTNYLRDARQRVTHVIDGFGMIVRNIVYGEDDLPNEIWEPNPASKSYDMIRSQRMWYTARKELQRQEDSALKGSTFTYGALPGQLVSATDALGRVTRTNYETATQRPIETIEAEGSAAQRRTLYTWESGLLTETKVLNPVSMTYSATYRRFYDKAGRLERVEAPLVAPEQFSYNEFGELSQKVQGPLRTIQFTYNSLGQATNTDWIGLPNAQTTTSYNGIGLPASVSDGSRTVEKTYDVWKGTLKDEIFRVGGQVWKMQTHTTDAAGNPVELLDSENKVHEWPVDVNNRPSEVRLANKTVSQTIYTPGGLVDQEILKNTSNAVVATTTHSYDSRGRRVRSLTMSPSSNKVVSDYSYSHNDAGEVTKVDFGHLGTSFNLVNDAQGRISSWSTPGNNGGASAPPFENTIGGLPTGWESTDSNEAEALPAPLLDVPERTVAYTYDEAGNRRTQTVGATTTTYVYNEANQLVSETSPTQTITHQYDTYGNEVAQVTQVTGGGTITEAYGYNHLNMLSAYSNDATGATWLYDAYPTGERYAKTNLATNAAQLFIYRGWNVVTDYTKSGSGNPNPQLANTYAQGLSMDSKVMRLSASGDRRYTLGDAVGTLGTTLNDVGSIMDRIIRDPFGMILSGGAGEPFAGIAGLPTDGESGLDYVRHRMYRPRTGRFTQTDPILKNRASKHYGYANNNPAISIDPMGLQDRPKFGGGKTAYEDLLDLEERNAQLAYAGELAAGMTAIYLDTLTSIGDSAADFLPVIGNAKGLIEYFTGKSLIANEDLGAWKHMGLVGVFLPMAKALKKTKFIFHVAKSFESMAGFRKGFLGVQATAELLGPYVGRIARGRRGTFGIPDNIRISDNVIDTITEVKFYGEDTFKKMAESAKADPTSFVRNGALINGKRYRIQFFQHNNTLDTIRRTQGGLDGIEVAQNVENILIVPSNAPKQAVDDIVGVFNSKGIAVTVEYSEFSTKQMITFTGEIITSDNVKHLEGFLRAKTK